MNATRTLLIALVALMAACTRIEHPGQLSYERIFDESMLADEFWGETRLVGSLNYGATLGLPVLNQITVKSPFDEMDDFRLETTFIPQETESTFRLALLFGISEDQRYALEFTPSGVYSLSITKDNGTQRRLVRPTPATNWKPQEANSIVIERIGENFFITVNSEPTDKLRHAYEHGTMVGVRTQGDGYGKLESFTLHRVFVTEED